MIFNRLSQTVLVVCLILVGVQYACDSGEAGALKLSDEEQKWLKQHNEIVLAVDNTYAPLNYMDNDGQLKGLNIDLIQLIQKHIGVQIRLEGSTWDEALSKAMNHEVDGVINATPLEERKSRLNFTDAFFKDPLALVTYKENTIQNFENIQYQRIAAKRGSQHLIAIRNKIPEHLVIPIQTLDEGIELLSAKKIDGIYDDLAPLYHIISSEGYSHLKVAFVEPAEAGARIAVRNDSEVLLSILNKAINKISAKERLEIQNKWLRFSPKQNYRFYYITIAVLIAIVLLVSLWTWSLKLMVNKKIKELHLELQRRKEAEVQLIGAKEKAEESDRLKSAFLANISHEIRTPMNSIVGFSEVLQHDMFSREEQSQYLGLILSSANQLLSIINDLVNISKIEANMVDVEVCEVDINKMLEELIAAFKVQFHNKEIELSYECKQGSALLMHTDEVKLRQVLTNLIGNALKNTKKGYVKFGVCEPKDGMVKFFVKDSGRGIEPESHKLIFNRFSKINYGDNDGGTGLGLAISKAHVELMGGKIWVESVVGEGSGFYFTLPLAD
ncbi:ATP-binding protein [Carboxylicivirga marina]|uniref:ATP-binding protein n=1 Tax=Carboxylicivirga marina TaxID=2800988 RepID=UPI0025934FA9|nr:transporter substrate-binding domain-containing protein [uncultured Carboxylicivirga sp.]